MLPTATFQRWEISVAFVLAALMQVVWFLLLSSASPPHIQADISDEATRPMAVAITPVPVLKYGSLRPGQLPKAWQRHPSIAPKPVGALPSPAAEPTPEAIPDAAVPEVAVRPVVSEQGDAGVMTDGSELVVAGGIDAGPVGSASFEPGSPEGSEMGTETDPLKARAISMYRGQLAAWFLSRFGIRGKIPFDTLKSLRAVASVSITSDRTVGGFSIGKPSGNDLFDGEVRAALSRVQSSGATLPPPPPLYPDVLGQNISVSFQCTIRSQCE